MNLMNTNPKAIRILCYGDSNTWGHIPGSGQRYPADKRWTGILQNQLGDGYEIIEEGLGGRTTNIDDPTAEGKNGATYLKSCLRSHYPIDLVVIMLGTNDLKERYGRNPVQIAEGMDEVISLIKNPTFHYGNEPKIVLMSPPIVDESVSGVDEKYLEAEGKSRQLASEYQKIAEKYDCVFINTAEFIKSSKTDGYHLEPVAHKALADILTERIKKIYG